MIDKLMSVLNRGGALTIDRMARELDTTPELVTQLIEYLERTGVLKKLDSDCNKVCSGCYLVGVCQPIGQSRIWQVVD